MQPELSPATFGQPMQRALASEKQNSQICLQQKTKIKRNDFTLLLSNNQILKKHQFLRQIASSLAYIVLNREQTIANPLTGFLKRHRSL